MKLKYQTGVATLIQFITMSFLGIPNGLNSVVTTCHSDHGDCLSNLISSLVYFILLAAWFGAIWVLGYGAQKLRSRHLSLALIGAEGLIALVAAFNAKHYPDILGLVTSLVDLVLAIWVISLACRLLLSRGKRIPASRQRQRGRSRKKPE